MLYLMEINHNVTHLHNHPMPCVGGKFCGRLVDISIRVHLIPNVAVSVITTTGTQYNSQ